MTRFLWLLERPWVVWLALLPVAIAYTLPFPWAGDDVFEMVATIRAVAEHPFDPQNPMLDLPGETSPRFTPYTLFWGFLTRLFRANALVIIQITAIANFLLFATGLTRFVSVLFADRRVATLLIPIMLVCWGSGYPMANGYHWWLFFFGLPYVCIFAYGVGFHALAEFATYLKSERLRKLVVYALLAGIVLLSHPVTGLFVFITAGLMALFETSFKRALLLQAVPVAAFAVAFAWPYFDYGKTLFSGATEPWYTPVMFEHQLGALGVALVGLPLAVWYAKRRLHMFAVAWLTLFIALYLLCWALSIYIGERFLFFAVLVMHLFIALYALETIDEVRLAGLRITRITGFRIALLLVILLAGARFRGWEIKTTAKLGLELAGVLPKSETRRERYTFLQDHLEHGDIVIAEGETGWAIPGMTGARLVFHQHGNPLLFEELEVRHNATTSYLKDALSLEERDAIRRRYNATHVLLDYQQPATFSPTLPATLETIGQRVAEQDSLALFRINM